MTTHPLLRSDSLLVGLCGNIVRLVHDRLHCGGCGRGRSEGNKRRGSLARECGGYVNESGGGGPGDVDSERAEWLMAERETQLSMWRNSEPTRGPDGSAARLAGHTIDLIGRLVNFTRQNQIHPII